MKTLIASLIFGFVLSAMVAQATVLGQTETPTTSPTTAVTSGTPTPTTTVPQGAPSTGHGG